MNFFNHLAEKWKINFHSRRKIIVASVLVVSGLILGIALFSGWIERTRHQEPTSSPARITSSPSETTLKPAATEKETTSKPTGNTTSTSPEIDLDARIDFASLLQRNQDTVGWIEIPWTVINYPVVKTDNNDFYLHNDFDKRKAKNGAIFMDFRNSGGLTDRHSILYGHHTRDGSMFTGLMAYKNEDFFKNNDKIFIDLPEGQTVWQIFSAYVTSTDFYYIITDFKSDQTYLDFLRTIEGKSTFQGGISPQASDLLLTLSTCTYEFDDARFVVHAIKIDE